MLSNLAKSITEGHAAIIESIDQLQAVSRSYNTAKPKIREMNHRLTAHLSRQNAVFFDRLRTRYQADRPALKIIEFLAHDIKAMKVKHLVFFDQHSGDMGDMSGRTFPKDFYDFYREVLTRIRIEEEYLLPLVEKM